LQKNTKISEAAEDNIGSAGILPAWLLLQDSQRDAGATPKSLIVPANSPYSNEVTPPGLTGNWTENWWPNTSKPKRKRPGKTAEPSKPIP